MQRKGMTRLRELFLDYWIVLILLIPVFFFITSLVSRFNYYQEQKLNRQCSENIKKIGEALRAYAIDHNGQFPPLSKEPGRLMFDPDEMYPQYLESPEWLVCPHSSMKTKNMSAEELIDDHSYYYITHFVTTPEEGKVFLEAYRKWLRDEVSFDEDINPDFPFEVVIFRISSIV